MPTPKVDIGYTPPVDLDFKFVAPALTGGDGVCLPYYNEQCLLCDKAQVPIYAWFKADEENKRHLTFICKGMAFEGFPFMFWAWVIDTLRKPRKIEADGFEIIPSFKEE